MSFKLGKFAIAASSQGSNAMSLIRKATEIGVSPEVVIVTNRDSALLTEVDKSVFVDPSQKDRKIFENEILEILKSHDVSWLFLAGFLRVLSPEFLKYFDNKHFYQIINIHPSLLPKYPGLHAYKKSYESEDEFYGHSIHLVNEVVDSGQIIFQKKLENKKNVSFEQYVNDGKIAENDSYAYVLEEIYTNGLEVSNSQVQIVGR